MAEDRDPFDLQRFVTAQAPVYETALAELRNGRKRSHWMWFIFPQISGLGSSPMAQLYAIGSFDEAAAYLDHPLLGPRLRECTEAMLAHAEQSAQAILGEFDALKLRSSMTLFDATAADGPFRRCLDIFYDGAEDRETLQLLGR